MADKLSGYIGFARRAGKLACGGEAAWDSLRRGRASVVLISSDAAKNTVKQIQNAAAGNHIRCLTLPLDKYAFGAAAGFAQLSAAAVENHSLAKAIIRTIETAPSMEK